MSRSFKIIKDRSLNFFYEKTAQEFNFAIIDILLHEENNKGSVKYRSTGINGILDFWILTFLLV